MRNFMLTAAAAIVMVAGAASSASAAAGDADKIALTGYVAPNCGVPKASQNVLQTKLNSVITSTGFGSEPNQRFILTARVNILSEDVTETAPPMYAYTLQFDLFIGDGMTGTLFASTQVEAKGVGNTKDKAYLQALKALNPRSPALKQFVIEGKEKIIDYYDKNGEAIIQRAESLAQSQKYDEALFELSAIPVECTALYQRACTLMQDFYTKQINEEGAQLLAQARAEWNAGQDREAADRAGAILGGINPQSSAYAAAQQLHNEISARIRQLDAREWAFKMQEQKNAQDLAMAEINAARDVAVAYAKNQPTPVYNIYWW